MDATDSKAATLPFSRATPTPQPARGHRRRRVFILGFFWSFIAILSLTFYPFHVPAAASIPLHASEILGRCAALDVKPGLPPGFQSRKQSDRFVAGTKPVLILNATIWTGDDEGKETFQGDVLLDKGLIKWIRNDTSSRAASRETYGDDLLWIDANGAWLTPGIVDLHSHLSVGPSPALAGAEDTNTIKDPISPWLRALDALNTHDASFELAIAGGVTTSLILPGSAGAINGQGFTIKLRPTVERSPTAMLLEPPYNVNGSTMDATSPPRWRHMKHACGENPSRVYSQTRMDTSWEFRQAYGKAREIKNAQDAYCAKARAGQWAGLGEFENDLQWEALVEVLRGRVKVQTHCYEAVDLDDFVRLSNEFKFPVAAFHHAHETYLVPEVLKRAYGERPPASAMFAAFARYKRESYRHSEFAPRILNDNGLKVVMKSDHPAIVSRYLMHEAQQAHYYGLPTHVAMSSVISTPAEVLGLDHRIGFIREGHDADLVLWDSHPLALGATPTQVLIDGIPQLSSPHGVPAKPHAFQTAPKTPNFDREAQATLQHDGLPPLAPARVEADAVVVFANVSSVWVRAGAGVEETLGAASGGEWGVVVTRRGRVLCAGADRACAHHMSVAPAPVVVDLAGGAITPGLVSFGTSLGLQEIAMEGTTTDGDAPDPLTNKIPGVLGGDGALMRAADGLQLGSRDMLLAYRGGVTSAVTAPTRRGFLGGLSVAFSTGAAHRLEGGAVVQDVAALHVGVGHSIDASVSTQIAALRRLLLEQGTGESGRWFEKVTEGAIPLVIDVHNADAIATLLVLKAEVEGHTGVPLKLTLTGATEAHLLAAELGAARVGVIVNPVRPFPYTWEMRRILPGPPLSHDSAIVRLMEHNVTVGVGMMGVMGDLEISAWAARNTRFDVGWAALEAGGRISKAEALALASTNIEKLLGIEATVAGEGDYVATRGGGMLDLESKVVGIVSARRGRVELLE